MQQEDAIRSLHKFIEKHNRKQKTHFQPSGIPVLYKGVWTVMIFDIYTGRRHKVEYEGKWLIRG